MIRWLMRQFNSMAPDPTLMDHVPVNRSEADPEREPRPKAIGEGLSHEQKLALAASRANKPFQCAADGLPRKIIKDGVDVTVGVAPAPVPQPEPPNVRAISGRKGR